jgi:hypothetical protein
LFSEIFFASRFEEALRSRSEVIRVNLKVKKSPLMRAGALAICASVALPLGAAEAPEIVLETGGSEAIVSAFRDLEPIEQAKRWVSFDFGFATIEEVLAGSFMDSATLTLQGSSPSATTIIGTLDRSGILWTPTTPGGVTLDPGAVSWTEIDFPDLSLELPHRKAYSAIVEIPTELQGQDLRFIIDLFDNQNGVKSVAYVSAPTVAPEPATMALAAAGLVILFGFKRRNK